MHSPPHNEEEVRFELHYSPHPKQDGVVRVLGVTQAPARAKRKGAPLAMSIVLDRSSSMTVPMMEAAKRAATAVVGLVRESDVLMALTFSDDVKILAGPSPCHPVHTRTLKREFKKIQARGGTRMSEALSLCARKLKPYQDHLRRVLFMTDGRNTENPALLHKAVKQCAEAGIEIHAWGFGKDWDADELSKIASDTRGRADVISTPAQAVAAFRGSFEAIRKTALSEVSLYFKRPQGVELQGLRQVYPQILEMRSSSSAPQRLVAPMGSFKFNERRSWLVELKLPPDFQGEALEVALEYRAPDGEAIISKPQAVEVSSASGSAEHPFVTSYLEQMELCEIATRGRLALAEGDQELALELLTKAKKRSEALGNEGLSALISELLERQQNGSYRLATGDTTGTRKTLALRVSGTVYHDQDSSA